MHLREKTFNDECSQLSKFVAHIPRTQDEFSSEKSWIQIYYANKQTSGFSESIPNWEKIQQVWRRVNSSINEPQIKKREGSD